MLHMIANIFWLALCLQVAWIVLSAAHEAVSPKARLAGVRAREAGEPVIQRFETWLFVAVLGYALFH